MTTKELLQQEESNFLKLQEFIVDGESYEVVLSMLDTLPVPENWVIELPSKAKQGETYKTIPVDIMEGAARAIFGEARLKSVSSPIITQDKNGKFAATVTIEYQCADLILPGIGTVYAAEISLLELAVPKASTMAIKNALKQLGSYFGKYLNRSEDQVELPSQKEEPKLTTEDLAKILASCTNADELKSYRLVAYAKGTPSEIQDLYETRLRELNKKK